MRNSLRSSTRLLVVAALCAVVAILVGACGSSSNSSSSSGSGASGASSSSASKKVSSGHFTIAYGEPAAVDEVTNRNVQAMQWAAKQLGWTLKYTNAQGNISLLNQTLTNEVNQGISGIVVGSTDANLIRPALLAAKQANIPAIVIGGGVPSSPLYAATITEDEALMSKLLTQYMVKDLGGSGDIAAINISQLSSGIQRSQARDAVLKGTGVKIVAQADGDLANPIKGTQQIAADIIAKHPNIKAIWLVYDYMIGPTVTALKQAHLNGKVKLYSWFAGPQNVSLLRDNTTGVRALVEDNFDHTALVAMDTLAGKLAAHKAINPNPLVAEPMHYEVVTTKNAPPPGTLLFPIAKNEAPFAAKWAQGQFGP
ncbi:MAG: sugar ABC transporter substrate-binding protein [Solirubrobacteraceae bacterium]